MQIEKLIASIRLSNIGKIMYKTRPSSNFLGVFGLKQRPPDTDFLESGSLEDIGIAPIVKEAYKRYRQSIPKDFAIVAIPEKYSKTGDKTFVHSQYHMVDIDLYTYLLVVQAIHKDKIPIESTSYNNLFLLDGRFVDYTNLINQNLFNYSFILGEYSSLIPYIYKKRTPEFFTEENVEDSLFNYRKCFSEFDVNSNFESLQILSLIDTLHH